MRFYLGAAAVVTHLWSASASGEPLFIKPPSLTLTSGTIRYDISEIPMMALVGSGADFDVAAFIPVAFNWRFPVRNGLAEPSFSDTRIAGGKLRVGETVIQFEPDFDGSDPTLAFDIQAPPTPIDLVDLGESTLAFVDLSPFAFTSTLFIPGANPQTYEFTGRGNGTVRLSGFRPSPPQPEPDGLTLARDVVLSFSAPAAAVPEPSTLLLLIGSGLGIVAQRRRSHKRIGPKPNRLG
jgi:hypothetical protein